MKLNEALKSAGLSADTQREVMLAFSRLPRGAETEEALALRAVRAAEHETRRAVEEIRLQLPRDAGTERVVLRFSGVIECVPTEPAAPPEPEALTAADLRELARQSEYAALQAPALVDVEGIAARVVDRLGGRADGV